MNGAHDQQQEHTEQHQQWDLGAWLAGATPPQRSVRVTGRGDLVAAYEALDAQLAEARAARGDGDRLIGRVAERRIAEEMSRIQDQIRASMLTITVRGLPAETWAEIDQAATGADGQLDGNERAAHALARAAISPVFTVEQARVLREAVGEGQFKAVWATLWAASNETAVDVPFSLAHSAALATQEPSPS